jgi:shikimate dehydrogenase
MQRSVWLLGDPVSHSVSPQLHNRVYQEHQLDFVYLLAKVPKDSIAKALDALATLGAAGANLTIPHKQSVLPYLARLSPAASAIGAVNCIRPLQEDPSGLLWEGHNTDAQGWLDSWNQEIGEPLNNRRCIVLGSGGTARSIVWALFQAGAQDIHLLAREPAKFQKFVDGPVLKSGQLNEFSSHLETQCVVINCTSVGMSPRTSDCPVVWPEKIPPQVVAVDVIYNPAQTRFLQEARALGARSLNGCGMLVNQALRAMDFFSHLSVSERCDAGLLRQFLTSLLQNKQ